MARPTASPRTHRMRQVQKIHFGTTRSSSRKVERSCLRRKRIKRRRSLSDSDMVSSIQNQHKFLPGKSRALGVGTTTQHAPPDRLLVNDRSDRDQRGNSPPENEAQFQHRLWQIQLRSDPGKSAPDERRAEHAKQPAGRGEDPEHEVAVRSLCGLLSTQANPRLRARSKVVWHGDGHGAKGAEKFTG